MENSRMKRVLFLLAAAMLPIVVMAQSLRTETRLTDNWRFSLENASIKAMGANVANEAFNDASWEVVSVPHDWAIKGPFDESIDKQYKPVIEDGEEKPSWRTGRTGGLPFIGAGWYRTKFVVPNNSERAILNFGGAMAEPVVYVNGHKAGEWKSGYTPFNVDITPYIYRDGRENTLAVRLEMQPFSSRWYPGAGLYRPVKLITTAITSFEDWGLNMTTLSLDNAGNVSALFEAKVKGYEGKTLVAKWSVADKVFEQSVDGSGVAFTAQNFSKITPWSPEEPKLYDMKVELLALSADGELRLIDSKTEKIGFRTIRYSAEKGFELNGKTRKFKGVCMHHDLGMLGIAENKAAIRRQLELLRSMGCDAIRTSHNIPSQWQMELCDELGFMVMAESFDEWRDGKVSVFNEYFFKDLSGFKMEWQVIVDGTAVLTGNVPSLNIKPQETSVIDLGITISDIKTASNISDLRSHDVYLTTRYSLKKACGILPAGTELSYDQICINLTESILTAEKTSELPTLSYGDNTVIFTGLTQVSGRHSVWGARPWKAVFDTNVGALISFCINGKEMMSAPLLPNFTRGITENDLGPDMDKAQELWRFADMKIKHFEVEPKDGFMMVTTEFEPIGEAGIVNVIYKVYADGTMDICESLADAGHLATAPSLPRFGMEMAMGGEFSNLEFYGLGPGENYCDRFSSSMIGCYTQRVEDQYNFSYARPQESGTKTGIKWWRVTDDRGLGFEISSSRRFSASALPFSTKTLDIKAYPLKKYWSDIYDFPTPSGRPDHQIHSLELKALVHNGQRSLGQTWICFDLAQQGVGGIDSWKSWPLPQHLVAAAPMEFHFRIKPIIPGL